MKLTSLHSACAAVVLALCGCTSTPPAQTPVTPLPSDQPPLPGQVLAHNDRMMIYLPTSGDSLRGLAARVLGSEDNEWQISEANGGLSKLEAGQPVVVPLKPQNPLGVWPGSYQTVPVLCYHRIGTVGGKMAVSPANFAAQMEWLVKNNYRVLKLGQLGPYLDGKQPLPPRSVVVTFDDGYESVYRFAFPVLKKLGLPATMFVYTDFLGAGDALTWPQLQEMSASGLMDIQSHSKSHRNLIERTAGETDDRYARNIEQEVVLPRDLLEKRLNSPVRHFAFPYGDANELVLDQLTRQKFNLAVTVNPGGNPFFAQPLMLRRTMIFGDHDLEAFKARLQTSRKIGGAP